jgi:hypothetical protein
VAHCGGSCRRVSTWTESCRIAISAEAAASICVQRGAGKPVAVYRKRALTVESGPPGKVRYCRPAAAEARRSTNVRAAEMRPATTEMGRSADTHAAAAEVSPAAHPMGDAASTAMKSATSAAMKSPATAAVESAATAAVKSTATATTATTATASSGASVSGARESGRQDNNAENLDF